MTEDKGTQLSCLNEAARIAECDKDDSAFDEDLKGIARQMPEAEENLEKQEP